MNASASSGSDGPIKPVDRLNIHTDITFDTSFAKTKCVFLADDPVTYGPLLSVIPRDPDSDQSEWRRGSR